MSKNKTVLAAAPAPVQDPLPTQPTEATGAANGTGQKTEKVKPKRPLPTPRVSTTKQFEIVRSYAHLSGVEGKGVKQNELAALVGMHVNTVSFVNAFLVDTGLIVRGDGGYVPAPEVVSYTNAYDWNPETAGQRLIPLLENTWFVKELMPKLKLRQSMDEGEAILELGTAVGVGKEYTPQVTILLDYMETVGLVQRENGRIILRRQLQQPTSGPATEKKQEQPAPEAESETTSGRFSSVATSFTQPTLGVVKFNVSVNVDMSEFAGWQADRIAAFFAGIAQVLAAKGMIEKDSSVK